MIKNSLEVNEVAREFINKQQELKQLNRGLNPANHNTKTKRYAKLSLSMTEAEKKKIQQYKEQYFPRTSISMMILQILEKEGVFNEIN